MSVSDVVLSLMEEMQRELATPLSECTLVPGTVSDLKCMDCLEKNAAVYRLPSGRTGTDYLCAECRAKPDHL